MAAGVYPEPASAPPVTTEEAEALARPHPRRIEDPPTRARRRHPRHRLGVAALWPFLDSGGYMAEMLLSGSGVIVFAPGWLLAGLLPLVAFYAGRLHFQAKKAADA